MKDTALSPTVLSEFPSTPVLLVGRRNDDDTCLKARLWAAAHLALTRIDHVISSGFAETRNVAEFGGFFGVHVHGDIHLSILVFEGLGNELVEPGVAFFCSANVYH